MAFQLAGLIQRLCADLRDIIGNQKGCIRINMPDELTPDKIQELIAGWVKETLNEDEQERARPSKRQTEDTVDDKYQGYDWVQTTLFRIPAAVRRRGHSGQCHHQTAHAGL